jgi:hypothetical protein
MNVQSMDALGSAQRVRMERVAFRHRLASAPSQRAARVLCADLLLDPPECLLSMDVHELLESCRGAGPAVADAWQTAAEIFRAVPIGDLTPWTRTALRALLLFEAPRRRSRPAEVSA